MPQTLSGTVSSVSRFLQQNSQALNVLFSGNPSRDFERVFTSTDVTKCYFNSYNVTTTPTAVDVTGLTDAYGQAISFGTVKHVQLVNNDAAANLTAGGGTNALFAALPALVGQAGNPNGSCVNLTTNLTADGTHKNIQLVASAGTISVDLFLVGT
jgi:hypothetical protein